jgi:hypothetical protein
MSETSPPLNHSAREMIVTETARPQATESGRRGPLSVAVGQPVEEGGPLGDGHGAGRPVRTVLGVPDQHGVPAEPDLDAGATGPTL